MMSEKPDAWLLGIFSQAKSLADTAGAMIVEQWGLPSRITHKGRIDLVTETDIAVESFLDARLSELVEDAGIMGEETWKGEPLKEWMWVVDPIDGTTNFVHHHPFVAVSIALVHMGRPMLAVVNAPLLNQMFWAVRGHGAFVGETRIQVSQTRNLEQAMVAFGIPYSIAEEKERWLSFFAPVLTRAQAMRRCGSAALDLCYVAMGIYDAYYERGIKPWDVAGGWLLVEEAGGRVTDFRGDSYRLGDAILASNGHVHKEIIALLPEASLVRE